MLCMYGIFKKCSPICTFYSVRNTLEAVCIPVYREQPLETDAEIRVAFNSMWLS